VFARGSSAELEYFQILSKDLKVIKDSAFETHVDFVNQVK
jgi:hypothetical protein